ncbi:MAG: tetratricopeptide repeat protein, partial [Desulfocapsaceae bacterium]|nr:tetratricopeptide repeat protein [Desulfocapsaceae bacterium]
MSLLMEALRKAEQAKKEAAGTEDMTVSPVALSMDQDAPVLPEAEQQLALEAQEALHDPVDMTVAADLSRPVVPDQGDSGQVEDGKAERTVGRGGEQKNSPVIDAGRNAPIEEKAPVSDDLAGRSDREADIHKDAKLPGEPPVAKAASSPDVVKPVPVSGPGQDDSGVAVRPVIVSAESSRQTARTVFAAKREYQRQGRNRRLLVLGIVSGLVAIGVAGFFFFVYQSLTPSILPVVAIEQKSTAQGREGGAKQDPVVAEGNSTSVLPAEGGAGAGSTESARGEMATASSKSESVSPASLLQKESLPQGTSDLSPSHDMNPVTNGTSTSSVSIPGATLSPASPKTNQDAIALSKEAPKAGLSPDSVFEPVPEKLASAPIVITHRSAQPLVSPLLTAAYGAYQKGDFAQAREKYQQVLQANPKHRGALLGLAALALQGHEDSLARDLYLRLLEQDPGDPLARAGLLAITPTGDSAHQESELKLLLEQYPHVAPLFFSLGNLYAAGNHWSEAQQAYFSALQAAKNAAQNPEAVHPDYSFNLAVSLEHLGQLKPAV